MTEPIVVTPEDEARARATCMRLCINPDARYILGFPTYAEVVAQLITAVRQEQRARDAVIALEIEIDWSPPYKSVQQQIAEAIEGGAP